MDTFLPIKDTFPSLSKSNFSSCLSTSEEFREFRVWNNNCLLNSALEMLPFLSESNFWKRLKIDSFTLCLLFAILKNYRTGSIFFFIARTPNSNFLLLFMIFSNFYLFQVGNQFTISLFDISVQALFSNSASTSNITIKNSEIENTYGLK